MRAREGGLVRGCMSARASFNDSQIMPSLLELSLWKLEGMNLASATRCNSLYLHIKPFA